MVNRGLLIRGQRDIILQGGGGILAVRDYKRRGKSMTKTSQKKPKGEGPKNKGRKGVWGEKK